MSKGLFVLCALLVALHSLAGFFMPAGLAQTAAIAILDILAVLAASRFFSSKTPLQEKAAESPVVSPVITVDADANAIPFSRGTTEAVHETERIKRQNAFLGTVQEFLGSQISQNRQLLNTKGILEALRSSLMTLNQFNENIQQNAKQVCGVAENLAGTTEQGFSLSQSVQSHVTALAESIVSASAQTGNLLEKSKKITDILTIMSDIAAMTKVLSINASIVAARAGTKGREFDVVAKEVRKLSIGTEESLANITILIQDIQTMVLDVSSLLKTVSADILKEKESLLSVAGTLQGVSLAIEIIRSITDVSGVKASEGQQSVVNTLGLVESVLQGCSIVDDSEKIIGLQAGVSDLIGDLE